MTQHPRFQIESITSNDSEALRDIACFTFRETFAEDNTPEDMELYLQESFSLEKLLRELKDPNCFYYFLKDKKEVKGYLKFTIQPDPLNIAYSNQDLVKLDRLYIMHELFGMGAGQQLMNFFVENAKKFEKKAAYLTVWSQNPRAIAFYKKWGFFQKGTIDFILGKDIQTDLLLLKELS